MQIHEKGLVSAGMSFITLSILLLLSAKTSLLIPIGVVLFVLGIFCVAAGTYKQFRDH